MRVIIAGSRGIKNYESVRLEMSKIVWDKNMTREEQKNVEIITGQCRNSPDEMGELFAKRNGLKHTGFPANWKDGKKAGPLRNRKMAEYSAMDNGILFVFWDGKSRGTNSMINEA